MSEQHAAMIFGNGVPTAPDVKRIMEALGVPEPGIVTHETLEELTGEKRTASRYYTVVKAWRDRLLKEHNVGTDAEHGVGIRILTPAEWVKCVGTRGRGAVRHIVRVNNFGAAVPVEQLDDFTRRVHDHQQRFLAAVGQTAVREHSALRKALKAPEQLPRLTGSTKATKAETEAEAS